MSSASKNSKTLTVSFALFSVLIGVTFSLLLRALSGAFGVVARALESDLVKHGFPVFLGFLLFLFLQTNRDVKSWAEEVVGEVRKVVWPSRKDAAGMTVVVLIMVLISSVVITTFDLVSGFILKWFMGS